MRSEKIAEAHVESEVDDSRYLDRGIMDRIVLIQEHVETNSEGEAVRETFKNYFNGVGRIEPQLNKNHT